MICKPQVTKSLTQQYSMFLGSKISIFQTYIQQQNLQIKLYHRYYTHKFDFFFLKQKKKSVENHRFDYRLYTYL